MQPSFERSRDSRARRALALLLGGAVVLGTAAPTAASAAPGRSKRKGESGLERSQVFVAEGEAAYGRGDYEDAIAKYSAAYYVLTSVERSSYAGSIPVRNAMRAYDQMIAQSLGRSLLDRQLGFVTEYLETVKANPDVPMPPSPEIIAELETKRSKIEKRIADLSAVAAPDSDGLDEPEPEPELEVEPEPETETEPTNPTTNPTTDAPPAKSRRPLGIALAATGAGVLGIGAGVLAGWWTVRNQAPGLADMEPGYEEGTAERADYLQREEDRARRYLISGAVVMTVGAAVAATGVALIVKSGKARSGGALSLAPHFGRAQAGLSVGGRF